MHSLLTLLLSALAISLTAPLSATITTLFAAVLVFVALVAPGVLVWAQRFKK